MLSSRRTPFKPRLKNRQGERKVAWQIAFHCSPHYPPLDIALFGNETQLCQGTIVGS